ncbi:hypothetical protein BDV30DRAFT_73059 [Aspergillus minisclerotigenes]|uniref:Transcription factor domain-containing protein n=1 Tax=Aspergillus minisclerotigenes TaxID=656917 RepID=A0A5N6JJZ7_9EURO|nr:hypothetical protein BDV30DRAFT_73059 [Aspergillus minisclerotigenes]
MFHSCPKNRLLDNNTVPLRKNAELKYIDPTIRSMDTVSNDTPFDVISPGPLMNPTAIDTTLYLQTRRIIQMTNQFVDDISAHYSRGIHRYLPIICRKRFHDYLIHVGASPPASFSVLLLSICLVTYHPEILPQKEQRISRESLYITVKLLFTQRYMSMHTGSQMMHSYLSVAVRGWEEDETINI